MRVLRPSVVHTIGILGLGAPPLAAQARTAIIVTAVVQQPVAVAARHQLVFGAVMPGMVTTVASGNENAGVFAALGTPGAAASLTFKLPAEVTVGTTALPVVAWAGTWTTGSACTATPFTPSRDATPAVFGPNGVLLVLVGATVQAAPRQHVGTYTGTLALTIAY